MTAECFQCPAAAYVRLDRHMVTDRRWMLTGSAGAETVVCSLACVITWACRRLPADVEAFRGWQETGKGATA
jgi:hypothetical protein